MIGKVADVYGAHRSCEGDWWTITHLPTGGALLRPDTATGADRALRLLAELAPGAGANWLFGGGPPDYDDPDFALIRNLACALKQRVDARRQDWPHALDAIRLAFPCPPQDRDVSVNGGSTGRGGNSQ